MSDTPAPGTDDVLAKPVSQLVPEPSKGVTEQEWLQAKRAQRQAREAASQAEAAKPEEIQTEAPGDAGDAEEEIQAEQQQSEATREDEADLRSEEETEASEAEETSEQQTETEEATAEEEEAFPETVAELAETLGFDPGDLAEHLQTTVKVNGETRSVTLAEAFKGYERLEDYKQKTAAVAEESKANRAEHDAAMERQNAAVQQLDAVAMLLAQQIDTGPSDAELAALRDKDPLRYRNLKDVRDEKMQALQQAMEARKQYNQSQFNDATQKQVKAREEQQGKLAELIPGIVKPEEQPKIQARIKEVMTDSRIGFSPQEVDAYFNGVFDARAIHAFHLLGQFFDQQKANKETRKVLKKKPKPAKAGARQKQTQAQADQNKVRSAKARLRKTGSKEDALALLRERRIARRNAANGGGKPQNYV